MKIEDGTGGGTSAMVDSNNMLRCRTVMNEFECWITSMLEGAYSVVVNHLDVDVDDGCFLYIKNTGNDTLRVGRARIAVDGPMDIYVRVDDDGTRNDANTITPVNRNAGSGNEAPATVESGFNLAAGAATLSGGSEIERFVFWDADDNREVDFVGKIAIPKNHTLTFWAGGTAGGSTNEVTMTLVLTFGG